MSVFNRETWVESALADLEEERCRGQELTARLHALENRLRALEEEGPEAAAAIPPPSRPVTGQQQQLGEGKEGDGQKEFIPFSSETWLLSAATQLAKERDHCDEIELQCKDIEARLVAALRSLGRAPKLDAPSVRPKKLQFASPPGSPRPGSAQGQAAVAADGSPAGSAESGEDHVRLLREASAEIERKMVAREEAQNKGGEQSEEQHEVAAPSPRRAGEDGHGHGGLDDRSRVKTPPAEPTPAEKDQAHARELLLEKPEKEHPSANSSLRNGRLGRGGRAHGNVSFSVSAPGSLAAAAAGQPEPPAGGEENKVDEYKVHHRPATPGKKTLSRSLSPSGGHGEHVLAQPPAEGASSDEAAGAAAQEDPHTKYGGGGRPRAMSAGTIPAVCALVDPTNQQQKPSGPEDGVFWDSSGMAVRTVNAEKEVERIRDELEEHKTKAKKRESDLEQQLALMQDELRKVKAAASAQREKLAKLQSTAPEGFNAVRLPRTGQVPAPLERKAPLPPPPGGMGLFQQQPAVMTPKALAPMTTEPAFGVPRRTGGSPELGLAPKRKPSLPAPMPRAMLSPKASGVPTLSNSGPARAPPPFR